MRPNRHHRGPPAARPSASVRYTRIIQCSFLVLTLVAGWLSHLTSNYLRKEHTEAATTVDVSSLVSSVWCHNGPTGEKLCRFRNLCYDPRFQEFQFSLTEESMVFGIRDLEQWKTIDMSTVLDHNAFRMRVSLMSDKNKVRKKLVYFQNAPTFIFHRFKPDNIMHVLHDDLIPLYFTVESVLDKKTIDERQFGLAFSDSSNFTELDQWYDQFSKVPTIRLPFANNTICFANAFVGLQRATVWYNYGFTKPQGPFINKNFNLNGLKKFVQFSLNIWQNKSKAISLCALDATCVKVVILSRERSRKILNSKTLITAIEEAHYRAFPGVGLEVVSIDLLGHDPSFLVTAFHQATIVIGMHGAGMILSVFLPPNSAIVELFPYAINPDHVSFLKALFKQHQAPALHYEFWQNKNEGDSVPGAHEDPLMGKISHLSDDIQKKIMTMTEVPPVRCCHDPAYLYYMYHDTYVQDDISDAIYTALLKTKTKPSNAFIFAKHMFPSLPIPLNCSFLEQELYIEWGDVSNTEENENVWYQITLLNDQIMKVVNVTTTSARKYWIKLSTNIESFQMWFQAFNAKNKGGLIQHETCLKIPD